MDEYTRKDIIIIPTIERAKNCIGKEVYFSDSVSDCLYRANNDINCYVIDNNISIPLLSDYTIHQFDNDELSLYTDITVFLKNEYTKIEEINNVEENGEKRTKLNLLILDKIKIYAEDTFNFIAMNVENQNNRRFFKEKLQLLISNINDYKKNFYIEPAKRNKIDNTVIDKPNCITKKSFSTTTGDKPA